MINNVIYFSNHLANKKGHGISRYSKNLLNHLVKQKINFKIIPTTASNKLQRNELQNLKNLIGLKELATGRYLTPFLWWFFKNQTIESILKLPNIKLVHNISLGYPLRTKKPYLVTIHDIGPLIQSNFFSKKDNLFMNKSFKQTVDRADKIICVSEATASTVEDYARKTYGVNIFNRIEIIHEGVSEHFFNEFNKDELLNTRKLNLNFPYLLVVGQISPRKNIEVVLKAFNKIKNKYPSLKICMVGGNGWDYKNIYKLINKLNIEHRVINFGYVSDEDLRLLYKKARVFVFPSLFEGFGLPVLEAMACKCPVICSDIPPLREISNGNAFYFNPNSLADLIDKIEHIFDENFDRKSFIEKAYKNSKTYNWDKVAKKTAKLYGEFL